MGKKGNKASKGGGGGTAPTGSAAASAAGSIRCTCEHPYQCSCGNRPDRPSRGHKWDPVEQKWGGKGHKQKGASTQAAVVGADSRTTAGGKTAVAQWQKLPHELLDELCKKEGRPRAKYKSIGVGGETGGGGGRDKGNASTSTSTSTTTTLHRFRVIVQDAKATKRGGEHDIILVPARGCRNEEQAREEAALLALLHLTPTIPHERKLPEPYRTTWTNAVNALKSGGGNEGKRTRPKANGSTATATATTANGVDIDGDNANKRPSEARLKSESSVSASSDGKQAAAAGAAAGTGTATRAGAGNQREKAASLATTAASASATATPDPNVAAASNNLIVLPHSHSSKPSSSSSSSTPPGPSSSSTTWLGIPHATAAERKKAADAKRKERNARIARREALQSANRNHAVFMSAPVRRKIERLLRGKDENGVGKGGLDCNGNGINDVGTGNNNNGENYENDDDDDDDDDDDEVTAYVVQRLVHEGFGKKQAQAACARLLPVPPPASIRPSANLEDANDSSFASLNDEKSYNDAYEMCLQYLCVHLNEEDLPEGFDPRGRTLDVVVANKNKKKEKEKTNGKNDKGGGMDAASKEGNGIEEGKRNKRTLDGSYLSEEAAALVDEFGLSEQEAGAILNHCRQRRLQHQVEEEEEGGGGKENSTIMSSLLSSSLLSSCGRSDVRTVLWEALCRASNRTNLLSEGNNDANVTNDQRRIEVAAEEMEALEAIFSPEECSVSREEEEEKMEKQGKEKEKKKANYAEASERGGKISKTKSTTTKTKTTTTVVTIALQPAEETSKTLATKLEVRMKDGSYPDTRPMAFVTGGWAGRADGAGTFVQASMVEFLSDLMPGEPMIYELYGRAQELLLRADGNGSGGSGSNREERKRFSSLLLSHLGVVDENAAGDVAERIPTNRSGAGDIGAGAGADTRGISKRKDRDQSIESTPQSSDPPKRRRRPRERSAFWSRRPSETLPAEFHPKINKEMDKARKNLPAHRARSEFLSLMSEACRPKSGGRVVLVTGETGCGKTTQIPQFLLENDPSGAKIVVAQPRRLAATGVASRVAEERGEVSPGMGSVGYAVRGDVAVSANARLVFCTTGVLLRQLQSEGALECISHVVVDEVHERNLDTDVLLGVLKECLPLNPHLKVVLMSATMDADRFAAYWGANTPRMHIPGFTYPVEDYFLEDVLDLTGYVPPKKGKKKNKGRFGHGGGGRRKQSPWADSEKSDDDEEGNEEGEDEKDDGADPAVDAKSSSLGSGPKRDHGIPLEDLVKRVDESDIDYDMIGHLIRHLLRTKPPKDDGSILVFLPGAPEIARAEDAVRRICRGESILILPLHGGLQPREQGLVFRGTGRGGATKIVLSTNVAETSITIPDCTVVVDACREKQSSYDPSNRMPLLVERFASRDSLRQRRGRAGRVRSGRCYKLISRRTHDGLPAHGTPEIRRCALDQTLLSLLFLGVERGSGNFLGTLLDPPGEGSVRAAIKSLEGLGAISSSGMENKEGERRLSLTPLGMHLAGIPAPPCVGKLLIMGSLLGCRGAALAVAAGMSIGRSPFLRVDAFRSRGGRGEEQSPEALRQERVLEERAALFKSVGNSDLALLAAAYMKWDSAEVGAGGRKKLCDSLGLSFNGMRDMKTLVRQLDSSLCQVGYYDTPEAEANSTSWRVIRSCIVSALSPGQVVRVERPSTKYADTVEGAVEKDGVARELKFYVRGDEDARDSGTHLNRSYHGVAEERVFMHPSSANFATGNFACPWLVYHELVRTSKAFLRDATECSSYALLLFGGPLEVRASEELIIIDRWVRLSANARIGALVGGLRRKVDDLLYKKVADPSLDIVGSPEMRIIVSLLKSDGLGQ